MGETLRRALNALAEVAPDLLRATSCAEWFARYNRQVEEYLLPPICLRSFPHSVHKLSTKEGHVEQSKIPFENSKSVSSSLSLLTGYSYAAIFAGLEVSVLAGLDRQYLPVLSGG